MLKFNLGFMCLPVLLGMFLILSPQPSWAANWEICDLKVKVLKVSFNQPLLYTEILNVKSKGTAECPQKGENFNFRPESQDYQSEIPMRQWPKANQTISIRYRYLDGNCKNTGPCRIKHYSLMSK